MKLINLELEESHFCRKKATLDRDRDANLLSLDDVHSLYVYSCPDRYCLSLE